LRQRADELVKRFRFVSPEERRQIIRKRIEQLRDEARRAKDEGRVEQAERLGKEADDLEQRLRESGPREEGGFRGPGPEQVQDILRAAEQAEREGRMDDARRLRQKAETIARELEEQKGRQTPGPRPGPEERQEIKRQIERLRDEARRAEEQGRLDQSQQISKEADRLEQRLREERPPDDERQELKRQIEGLRAEARQAKEQGRVEQAQRLGEEAENLERRLREPGPRDEGGFREQLARGIDEIRQEIGRLWQAVNEMRRR
jgi:DNA repair exonuclease SbcCD ATPase subunit